MVRNLVTVVILISLFLERKDYMWCFQGGKLNLSKWNLDDRFMPDHPDSGRQFNRFLTLAITTTTPIIHYLSIALQF